MRRLLALLLLGLAGIAPAAHAQIGATVVEACNTPIPYAAGDVRSVTIDPNGNLCTAATAGGGGDASAANQATQITAADATNAVLGTPVASPAANTIAARLKTLNTTLGSPLQDGGAVTVSGPVAVTGTFYQGTQPVSLASLPALAAGSAVIGHVVVDSAPTTAVTGTFFQATQPVSLATAPALVAGAAIIGKVGIDQTTPGTSNGVQVNAALPAGANVIGHVIVDTAPTTAVTGTFWQATQPVSAAALPLPSGAATAVKQPALGTAGLASADVITVQGVASMTPLKVDGSAVTQPVSGTFWQATQPVSGTVTANAGTNLNTSALALDTTLTTTNTNLGAPGATACATDNGSCALNALLQRTNQRLTTINTTLGSPIQTTGGTVGLVAGTAVIGHVINDASSAVIGHVVVDTAPTTAVTGTFWQATQPVSLSGNQAVNVAQVNGVTTLTGTGAQGTGAQRVTVATDSATVAGSASLPAGTNLVGKVGIDQTTSGQGGTNAVYINSAAFDVQTTITRPGNATPYTANDALGGALDLGVLGPSGKTVQITSVQLEADIAAIPTGQTTWVIYLYSVTPPSAIADNGAWDLPSGDRASFLGSIAIPTMVDLGSTLYVESNGLSKQVLLAGTHLFAYLVSVGGFTPAGNSEVYRLTIHTKGV